MWNFGVREKQVLRHWVRLADKVEGNVIQGVARAYHVATYKCVSSPFQRRSWNQKTTSSVTSLVDDASCFWLSSFQILDMEIESLASFTSFALSAKWQDVMTSHYRPKLSKDLPACHIVQAWCDYFAQRLLSVVIESRMIIFKNLDIFRYQDLVIVPKK